MAKRESSSEGPKSFAPSPTLPDASAAPALDRSVIAAQKIDGDTAEVVQWGNGAPESITVTRVEEEGAPKSTPAKPDKPAAKPAAKPAKVETKPAAETDAAESDGETTEEPAAAKKPADSERRRQILENIEREQKRVDAESRIKEEQTKREAAEAKLAEFEKSPLGKKIALLAKQHGMTVDDLKDKLLIGADDVLDKEPAPAAAPAKDPEVANLLKWKADREAAEDRERMAQAIGHVRESLKETDLPLVDSLDAYGRVLTSAYQAWEAEGKKGAVSDYIPDAAAIVEESLKTERPALARRLYAAPAAQDDAGEAETPAPAARPRPSMGKRTAARPGAKPEPLPMDPQERDRAIMKRFGWDT